jgi:hypothetical protein
MGDITYKKVERRTVECDKLWRQFGCSINWARGEPDGGGGRVRRRIANPASRLTILRSPLQVKEVSN